MNEELAFTPAWQLGEWIAQKKLSPVELTEFFLHRIEAVNPRLNAYLTINDRALLDAKAAEEAVLRGERLGSLHGVPISIKDLFYTKGLRSTGGSLVYRDFIPTEDSLVAERVRQAGAIILGKTNTPEFGLSGTTQNKLGGPCCNPWDPGRTTGGSSGGAGAAVAAGLGPLAIGSDGGGSIRIPSSFCGIYGLKPTQGRVPHYGDFGDWPLLSQAGPIVRTVRDAALLLQVLAGPDPRDPGCLKEPAPDFLAPLSQGVKGLRLAWSPDLGYGAVDPEVLLITSRSAYSFEELGARVEEPRLALESAVDRFWTIVMVDSYLGQGHLLESHPDQLTGNSRRTFEQGSVVLAQEYARSLQFCNRLRGQLDKLLEDYDLLLTPTTAVPAFPLKERPQVIGGRPVNPDWGFLPCTFPINMAGMPAASIPCGFSAQGLPIGLHIVGRHGEEATILRASAAWEQAHPWAQHRPAL